MKKLLVLTLLIAVILAISSCGETAESGAHDSPTNETQSLSRVEEVTTASTTIEETTTTSSMETTAETTTTTAPAIEPIIDHEILTMEECFKKVVENDAQEKVTEVIIQNTNDFGVSIAITESGKKYVLIGSGNGQCLTKMYINNALTDISDYKVEDNPDTSREHIDCDRLVRYRTEIDLFENGEELTLEEIISRILGTEMAIESIERLGAENTEDFFVLTIHCSYGIEIYTNDQQVSLDLNHIYHIGSTNSVFLEISSRCDAELFLRV